MTSSKRDRTHPKRFVQVSWNPPKAVMIKLNTDGAVKTNPRVGGPGGIFKNEKGNWVFGYY